MGDGNLVSDLFSEEGVVEFLQICLSNQCSCDGIQLSRWLLLHGTVHNFFSDLFLIVLDLLPSKFFLNLFGFALKALHTYTYK